VAKQTAAMAKQMALRRNFPLGSVVVIMLVSDVDGKAAVRCSALVRRPGSNCSCHIRSSFGRVGWIA
jgi:hypothetical protein